MTQTANSFPYQYYQFSNGIKLVHRQLSSNVAHLGIVVKVGSRNELPNQQGIAHFIEHCIFKGTKHRSNFQVLSRLENVGADLNAFTTKEDTTLFASIPIQYFERAAEFFADILFDSSFPDLEIEKEKGVVLDEINSYRDNPADWIHDEFDEVVFGNHPLGRNILGTPKTINKFNRNGIYEFYKKHYVPQHFVISSISSLPINKVVRILDKYFSMSDNSVNEDDKKYDIVYKPKQEVKRYSRHQVHVILGNIACNAYHPKRTAMNLLSNMLGGPAMNSILNLALREKNGIAYNLETNYSPYSDTGLFSIYFGTDVALLEKAQHIILKELDKLKSQPVSSSKINTYKKQIKGQLAVSLESHQNEMLSMGKNMMVYDNVDTYEEICRKIDNITPHELWCLANEVLETSTMSSLCFTR